MAGCAATCGHYRIVAAYRDERAGQVDRLDREAVWPEEEAAWLDEHGPLIVFKAYLVNIGAERREHERDILAVRGPSQEHGRDRGFPRGIGEATSA